MNYCKILHYLNFPYIFFISYITFFVYKTFTFFVCNEMFVFFATYKETIFSLYVEEYNFQHSLLLIEIFSFYTNVHNNMSEL